MRQPVSPCRRDVAVLAMVVGAFVPNLAGTASGSPRANAPTFLPSTTVSVDARLLAEQAAQLTAKPITDCSDDKQLQADAAAGGSFTFQCVGEIRLAHLITVTKDLSLTSPDPASVTISGDTVAPGCKSGTRCLDRAFEIDGATVSLTGLTIDGTVTGASGPSGGGDGESVNPGGGAILVAGGTLDLTNDVITASSAQGGDGGDGANRGSGGEAGSATGGAVYVAAGATLNANQLTIQNSAAFAGNVPIVWSHCDLEDLVGGCGGYYGGQGGAGGTAQGGALYVAGTLNIVGASTFTSDQAASAGGPGGDNPSGVGGPGGAGGTAEGGAIYVAAGGSLNECVQPTFSNDLVTATPGPGGNSGSSAQGQDGAAGVAAGPNVYYADNPAGWRSPMAERGPSSGATGGKCPLEVQITPIDLRTSPFSGLSGVLSGNSWQGRGATAGFFAPPVGAAPTTDDLSAAKWNLGNTKNEAFQDTCLSGCTNVLVAVSDVNGMPVPGAQVTVSVTDPRPELASAVKTGRGYLCVVAGGPNGQGPNGSCGMQVKSKTDSGGLAFLRYYAPGVALDESQRMVGNAYPGVILSADATSSTCNSLVCKQGAEGGAATGMLILPHDIYQSPPIGSTSGGIILPVESSELLTNYVDLATTATNIKADEAIVKKDSGRLAKIWKAWDGLCNALSNECSEIAKNANKALDAFVQLKGVLMVAWYLSTFDIYAGNLLGAGTKEVVAQIVDKITSYSPGTGLVKMLTDVAMQKLDNKLKADFGGESFGDQVLQNIIGPFGREVAVRTAIQKGVVFRMTTKLYEVSYCGATTLCSAGLNAGTAALYVTFSARTSDEGVLYYHVAKPITSSYNPIDWIPGQCRSRAGCNDPYGRAAIG